MRNNKRIALTALFAALVFILTAFLHLPIGSGYVHFGDSMIYLSALLLGSPFGALAGAVGGLLADVLSGYAVYAPATAVIKALIAFCFIAADRKRLFSLKNSILTLPAGIVTVGGYFVADLVIDKAFAVSNIPWNALQAFASSVIFIALSAALSKSDAFSRFINR